MDFAGLAALWTRKRPPAVAEEVAWLHIAESLSFRTKIHGSGMDDFEGAVVVVDIDSEYSDAETAAEDSGVARPRTGVPVLELPYWARQTTCHSIASAILPVAKVADAFAKRRVGQSTAAAVAWGPACEICVAKFFGAPRWQSVWVHYQWLTKHQRPATVLRLG